MAIWLDLLYIVGVVSDKKTCRRPETGLRITRVVYFWATVCIKRFAVCYHTVVCPVCLPVCPVCCVCPVLSVTLMCCGQTVGRIKMKFGTQVGLGPGHIV